MSRSERLDAALEALFPGFRQRVDAYARTVSVPTGVGTVGTVGTDREDKAEPPCASEAPKRGETPPFVPSLVPTWPLEVGTNGARGGDKTGANGVALARGVNGAVAGLSPLSPLSPRGEGIGLPGERGRRFPRNDPRADRQDGLSSTTVGTVGTGAPPGEYRLLTDATAVQEALPALLSAPHLGFDVETTGLDPHADRLRLVQLAVPGGPTYVVDCFVVDPRVLAPVFEHATLVGHNLKFDLRFLMASGLPVPDGKRLFDTILAAQLLDAGLPNPGHGLDDLARRFLGVELPKALQQADWSGRLSPAMIEYAARDAAIVLPLRERLQAEIAGAKLERVSSLEFRALPAVAWLEHSGAPFDTEAWRALADAALLEKLRLADELTALAEALLGKNSLFGREVNWESAPQVLRLLREAGLDLPNTAEEALLAHRDHPLVSNLLTFREAAKRCGTYGLNVLADVHPATGRIHADWRQIGAASGRMACTKPNLQNVPRTPAYRACFKAPEGRVLVKADYSQIELRIAAEIAGDQRMLDAYQRGEDVHAVTARLVLGKQEVTKEDRQAAKALNFGLIYGMGAATLRQHAASGYGVHLTEEEAQRFREAFFRAYPGLRRWHRSQPEGEIETRTLAGRRRLNVARYTEKLNTPVQGTGADGLKAALALLWETRDRCPSAVPVLAVHDELVLECDEQDAETARQWLTDCMRRGMAAFLRRVPVAVEARIARDWSGGEG